jgi:hypothetical protein
VESQGVRVRAVVFDATFNNISVISLWSFLLVEETGLKKSYPDYNTSTMYIILIHKTLPLTFGAIMVVIVW